MEISPLRLLVCGGRTYWDTKTLNSVLSRIQNRCGIAVVIHGAAQGADKLAAAWAIQHGIPTLAFPAEWEVYGRRAGPIRNLKMLREGMPDAVMAFDGGSGTADMVRQAKAAGIKVWRTSDHG